MNDNDELKFGESVLIEIVAIVTHGMLHRVDVSQLLRDVSVKVEGGKVVLSDRYERAYDRSPSS